MQPAARRGNKGIEEEEEEEERKKRRKKKEEKEEELKPSLHAILTSILMTYCVESTA